ncbi:sporulation protein YqfD [Desulfitibacter alkalitolerans]|uniref:sporulation protein YqfD n=1 Tax=Desulfitibacter alkalitolerans TaxID=264641 RepID=UPI0004864D07|nr:sporulation protein YqfD [Desulfitibacter alkalitolerans]
MKLKKLLLFMLGYVVVMIEGPVERFINLSITRGINLKDLRSLSSTKIQFKIPLHDFWTIRSIVRQTGCRVKILDKRGFPFFWSKAKKRKLLIVGLITFVVSMYVLSSFVWFIDVYSHEDLVYLKKHEIIEIAKKSGLGTGVYKNSINVEEIERKMVSQIPEISWVGLKFQGTRVIIEVVERKLPSEEHMDKEPKHLIAAKDGIIHEILVMMGQPLVQVGDTVEAGQILISGIIVPPLPDEGLQQEFIPQELKRVRARGIVRARVWYEGQGTAELMETVKHRTGATQRAYYLNLPDKKIVFKGSLDSKFKNYETEINISKPPKLPYIQIPGEIVRVTYHEVNVETRTYEKEEALSLIRSKLIEGFNLPAEAKIVDQEIKLLVETDQRVVIKLIIETIEDIARLSPVE